MAIERLSIAAHIALATLAGLLGVACDTRNVYLVPSQDPVTGAGGGGGQPTGAGGSPLLEFDGGVRDGGRPTCETDRSPQQPQPLGVYLMVDQSTAMQNQWPAVSAALSQFIRDSSKLGNVSVGIQYYAISPDDVPHSIRYESVVCEPKEYQTPKVPIAPLPGNEPPLLDSIQAQGPNAIGPLLAYLNLPADGSPRDAALRGAIEGARGWSRAHADTHPKAVVVLVTNGFPSTMPVPLCPPSAGDGGISAGAAGISESPPVTTYVLNVGPPNAELDAIARAGGTEHAYSAETNAAMVTALQSIRVLAVPCDVSVAGAASALSDERLNVDLSAPAGTARFGRVLDASGDSGTQGCKSDRTNEWYTDGQGSAATVHLCPNTCAYVRTVKNATLEVVIGCKTTIDSR